MIMPTHYEFYEGNHFVIADIKACKFITYSSSMKEWMWGAGIDTARAFVSKEKAIAFLNSHPWYKESAKIICVDVKTVYSISEA